MQIPITPFTNTEEKVSTISTRQRNNLQQELKDQCEAHIWKEEEEKTQKERIREIQETRKKEKIREALQEKKTMEIFETRNETIDEVFRKFSDPSEIYKVLKETGRIEYMGLKYILLNVCV